MARGVRAEDAALARLGYRRLPGLAMGTELDALRQAFDRNVLASDLWPAPRGLDWRHARLDHDPGVQRLCRAPRLLAGVHAVLRRPFFLAQVEGREPLQGGGAQPLHRDSEAYPPAVVAVLVYLDAFGPDNGATRLIPGSHVTGAATVQPPLVLSGEAGEAVLFDARLLHGATTNASGQRRRTLSLSYVEAAQLADYRRTAPLRGVRMQNLEVFDIA